jgi:hypothetical protein
MAGSNDLPTRKKIFLWIQAHEKTFYLPRSPVHPIGVYFSPLTRDFYAEYFIRSYRGILILLMQKHLEFQVVTPRTLKEFTGSTLVLPDVRILDDAERTFLRDFIRKGHTLVVTGTDSSQLGSADNIIRFPQCPGKAYMNGFEKDFEHPALDAQEPFLKALKTMPAIEIAASPNVATSVARVDGKLQVFLANFAGLRGGVNPVQTPQSGIRMTISAESKGKGFYLPFLGEIQELDGSQENGHISYVLPPVSKGAVFWYEPLIAEKPADSK